MFDELKFGVYKKVDLHGLSKEEAKAELCNEIFVLDNRYTGLMIVHGYHSGTVLKSFVRNEFKHDKVEKKINVDASVTYLKIKHEK